MFLNIPRRSTLNYFIIKLKVIVSQVSNVKINTNIYLRVIYRKSEKQKRECIHRRMQNKLKYSTSTSNYLYYKKFIYQAKYEQFNL